MQAGDTVQVKQMGQGAHWIYATVITVNTNGSAFVQINHRGNIDHGALRLMTKDKIRDKAAVQKLIDAMPPQAIGKALLEKRSLQVQIENLS